MLGHGRHAIKMYRKSSKIPNQPKLSMSSTIFFINIKNRNHKNVITIKYGTQGLVASTLMFHISAQWGFMRGSFIKEQEAIISYHCVHLL